MPRTATTPAKATGGPRTPAGRARASRNALRHGLTATAAVVPEVGERAEDLDELVAAYRERLAPDGPLEADLVDRLAHLRFRLDRATRGDAALWRRCAREAPAEDADAPVDREALAAEIVARLRRHGLGLVVLDGGGAVPKAEPQLTLGANLPQAGRTATDAAGSGDRLADDLEAVNAAAATVDHAALERLARYEAHLSREYDRTLDRLERLQRLRAGEAVPAPARLAVDLAVSRADAGDG